MDTSSPLAKDATPVGIPDPALAENPSDPAVAKRIAKEVAEAHRVGKTKRKRHDLTCEKYLVHIDGEGDGQWADIVDGCRVDVPINPSGGLRFQYNLERPLTENMVAYHTAQPFQVIAQATASNESRDRARIDTIFANDILRRQRVNEVVADALFMGGGTGFCPVHVQWRDDLAMDLYEPVFAPPSGQSIRPGYIDIQCGDPFATVFNDGAKRHSIEWLSYDRVYPATMVREKFAHMPGIEKLEGSDELVSASRMQRIFRKWGYTGYTRHDTAGLSSGLGGGDELIVMVCQEIAPGVLPDYPQGRLRVIALNGASDADSDVVGTNWGDPILLHDGPLPGRTFSVVPFYAGFRGDDVLGKPYVADIDLLQVLLNQYITLEAEFLRRYARPPFKTLVGSSIDDTITTEDDAIMEFTDPQGLANAGFLYPPVQGSGVYNQAIERTMDQMFRIAGWQAASRGESHAGDAAAKVVALAEADDTIFWPVNQAMRSSLTRLLQTCHRLAKQFMDVPWLVQNVTGDDLAYLAEPYIHKNELSDDVPDYVIVSGFGATPRAKTTQLMGYVTTKGADGMPLLETDDFWRLNPDQTLRPPEITSEHIKEARAKKVNEAIKQIARNLEQQFPGQSQMFVAQAHQMLMQEFPPKRDDPVELHIEVLSQLTQDEQIDPLARTLATMRQDYYYAWQAQIAAAAAGFPMSTGAEAMAPAGANPNLQLMQGGAQASPTRMDPGRIQSDVQSLTERAKTGAVQ